MNHAAITRTAPQRLLSGSARIAAAVAVATLVAVAWVGAQHASHDAVQSARIAFAPDSSRITLPSVVIVGHRARALAATGASRRGV